jgi:cytochrome c553
VTIARFAAFSLLATSPLINASPAFAGPPETYKQRCSMCHQSDAAGLAGQFPRLAGRVGTIASSPEGRHYLMIEVLNGMYGTIQVDGQSIQGMMPTMRVMSDGDIADVLNHLVKLKAPAKKVAPFTAAEVARVRAEPTLPGSAVSAERARLVAAGKIP